jgi:hypothetical protein
MLIILTTQEEEIRRIMVYSQLEQIVQEILSRKIPNQKWAVRVSQMVERLPSRCEVLSSNPVLKKRKKTIP